MIKRNDQRRSQVGAEHHHVPTGFFPWNSLSNVFDEVIGSVADIRMDKDGTGWRPTFARENMQRAWMIRITSQLRSHFAISFCRPGHWVWLCSEDVAFLRNRSN